MVGENVGPCFFYLAHEVGQFKLYVSTVSEVSLFSVLTSAPSFG
jgi:hypothetical protein